MKKELAALLFLLAFSSAVERALGRSDGLCDQKRSIEPRPHSVSILEFGAVGDGKTSNTLAFQNAIFYLKSFAEKGGAQLYLPAGSWLTGSFNLTSHLTLFLDKEAVILGSQDYENWRTVEPLPSYGRGLDVPGRRYRSLISGDNLTDVVITGDNGTINGQGSVWWELFNSHSLNFSRPHLVEFVSSEDIIISNLTLLNTPAWNIHTAYCSGVLIQNITACAPPESPLTSGIIPDSSQSVCIEDCNITTGHDAISLKSGWDEYGITYGRPTTGVHIRGARLRSAVGTALSFGSEMSGGISDIVAEHLLLDHSLSGIGLKTCRGRGGYIKDVLVSDVELRSVGIAIQATGQFGVHPDDRFDPNALPVVQGITLSNMVGINITIAGNLSGIDASVFSSVCLSNISLSATFPWVCSNVSGYSRNVSPEPCPDLHRPFTNSSGDCFSLLGSIHWAAVL